VGRTARAGRAGWSLSFVTQFDVQLVQKVEALIGHQLGEMKLEEAQVLKGISRCAQTSSLCPYCEPSAWCCVAVRHQDGAQVASRCGAPGGCS
jgi:hypothetical protein